MDKAYYTQQPQQIICMPLPDGRTDIWLTKNPEFITNENGEFWTAYEQYMRYDGNVTAEQIDVGFENWWEYMLNKQVKQEMELDERIALLESIVDELLITMLETAN